MFEIYCGRQSKESVGTIKRIEHISYSTHYLSENNKCVTDIA